MILKLLFLQFHILEVRRVTLRQPLLAETTDYYPFGGIMRRFKTTKDTHYRFGYQGQYAEEDTLTGWNAFEARNYDPHIGRWISGDPLKQFKSPYLGLGNNPINSVDPDGRFKTWFGAFLYKLVNGGDNIDYAQDRGEYYVGSYNKVYGGSGFHRQWDYTDGGNGLMEHLWNSNLARSYVPDFVNIGFGYDGIVGIGAGTNFDLYWVTRGKEASFYPMVTATQAWGAGYSVDATVNIGGAYYLGPINKIRRNMIETSIEKGDVTYWASAGVSDGGKIGVQGSYTKNHATGYGIIGTQVSIGGALPTVVPVPNVAGGVSNTWILHDWYHK